MASFLSCEEVLEGIMLAIPDLGGRCAPSTDDISNISEPRGTFAWIISEAYLGSKDTTSFSRCNSTVHAEMASPAERRRSRREGRQVMKTTSPATSRAMPGDEGGGARDYNGMSIQQLEQRREEEMNRQEEELEAIHHGVKGLKQHAIAINEAVVEDIEILKDLDHRMDTTQDEIKRGTDKAIDVNKKKAHLCKLYGLIAALVAAEVVLSAAGIRFV